MEIKKKILVLGGYGYHNTGDEAQLAGNLNYLKKEFPDYLIKVLTPNKEYTKKIHNCEVGLAPRVAFYDIDKNDMYRLENTFQKVKFILRSLLLYINTLLIKHKLPPIFINQRMQDLFNEIRTANFIFYSGGGFLTGKTKSRLWEAMLIIRIAYQFNVPSYLSGQTIGLWEGIVDKTIAKWGLSKAKIIVLRDSKNSINDLKKIGLEGKHIYSICDDAFFSDKLKNKYKLIQVLIKSGLSKKEILNGYITFHLHYWELKTEKEKKELLSKTKKIVSCIQKFTKQKIVLIPMAPQDIGAFNDLKKQTKGLILLKYDFSYKLIRAVIGNSELCVTMKHHPLIYSILEKTPLISLTQKEYYVHKNIGSLSVFGLEEYNVCLEKKGYLTDFNNKLKNYLNEEKQISKIPSKLKKLKAKKLAFMDLIKKSQNQIEKRFEESKKSSN